MPTREKVLLLLTIVGFTVPNVMLAVFLARGGAPGDFIGDVYGTLPAAQFTMDLTIAFAAFTTWTVWDGPRSGIRRWWVTIPASLLVGLCFALPLYLLMRERALRPDAAPALS